MALKPLFNSENLNSIVSNELRDLEGEGTYLKLSDKKEINKLVIKVFENSFMKPKGKYTIKIYSFFETSITKAIKSSIKNYIRISEIIEIAKLFKVQTDTENLNKKNNYLLTLNKKHSESEKLRNEIEVVKGEINILKKEICYYQEKEKNRFIMSNEAEATIFKILLRNEVVSFSKENQVIINEKNAAKAAEDFTETTGLKSIENLALGPKSIENLAFLEKNLETYVQLRKQGSHYINTVWDNCKDYIEKGENHYQELHNNIINKLPEIASYSEVWACQFHIFSAVCSSKFKQVLGQKIPEYLSFYQHITANKMDINQLDDAFVFMCENGFSEKATLFLIDDEEFICRIIYSLAKMIARSDKNGKITKYHLEDLIDDDCQAQHWIGFSLAPDQKEILKNFIDNLDKDIDKIHAYCAINKSTSNPIINLIGEHFANDKEEIKFYNSKSIENLLSKYEKTFNKKIRIAATQCFL